MRAAALRQREQALEARDPGEHLRPVAHGGVEPAPQLALAEPSPPPSSPTPVAGRSRRRAAAARPRGPADSRRAGARSAPPRGRRAAPPEIARSPGSPPGGARCRPTTRPGQRAGRAAPPRAARAAPTQHRERGAGRRSSSPPCVGRGRPRCRGRRASRGGPRCGGIDPAVRQDPVLPVRQCPHGPAPRDVPAQRARRRHVFAVGDASVAGAHPHEVRACCRQSTASGEAGP